MRELVQAWNLRKARVQVRKGTLARLQCYHKYQLRDLNRNVVNSLLIYHRRRPLGLAPSVYLKVDFHCRVIFTSERLLLRPYKTEFSKLTQQDDAKKRTAKRLCVTNVTGRLPACLAEIVFKQNCFHACHTRFAVFFPLPWLPLCKFTNVYGRSHKKRCRPLKSWSSLLKLRVTRTYISYIVLHSLFLFTRVKYAVLHYNGNPPLWREPRCTELMEMT